MNKDAVVWMDAMNIEYDRTDLLLKIITVAEGDPITPVQLQKVAFLVGQECAAYMPSPYYDFVPYDYGPFCIDIYRDAETLENRGLVSIACNPTGGWKEYSATFRSSGADTSAIPKIVADYIEKAVNWARELTFRELVSSIYYHYPAYGQNSIFNGQ